MKMKENIFLVGFSGTGKTSTGLALAARLGFEYIDTDLQIAADTGRSVPEIFEQDGEAAFRELERETIERLSAGNFQVVATGGGAVLLKANRAAMFSSGYVVGLEARPETIYVRLLLDSTTSADAANRPLLRGDNQFERISTLKAQRQPLYAEVDWTVHTDFMDPEEVASEIERALVIMRRRSDKQRGGPGSPATPGTPHSATRSKPFHRGGNAGLLQNSPPDVPAPAPASRNLPGLHLQVGAAQGSYPILFGEGLLDRLGEILLELLPDSAGRQVFVISDTNVAPLFAGTVQASLSHSGYRPRLYAVAAGESSKSLAVAGELYDWLAAGKAERNDMVLALGGGVVGDLSGFVASSWLRGLPLVQVPTTLLAMVDSSVGGKTGVNHPAGKNLIGAFYPPRAVVADLTTLTGMAERARRSGWSEVIKHAVIPGTCTEGEALARFERLERGVHALNAGDMSLTAAILRESVAVKAGVVEQDERETGLRLTLNYGHTYGHALEAAGHYEQLLHGEAIAIGLHGVARLSQRLGLCDGQFVERQRALLQAFTLPVSARSFGLDRQTVLRSMRLDKKVDSGAIRWILPLGIGRLSVRNDVPEELVAEVLEELL